MVTIPSLANIKFFNTSVNRFLSTPLKQPEYTKEYKHTLNTWKINGFDKQLIDKMITFRGLKNIKQFTTLST